MSSKAVRSPSKFRACSYRGNLTFCSIRGMDFENLNSHAHTLPSVALSRIV
jgi:hypothetical protein